MSIESIFKIVNNELIRAFAELDGWFDYEEHFLREKITGHQWSAAEILEHVMHTNNYLLLSIEKGSGKALKRAREKDLSEVLRSYRFQVPGMDEIAMPGTFEWNSPAHMLPNGTVPLPELRAKLRDQLYRCLCQLDLLCNGEGVLVQRTMSVNRLGKLDLYQYLYFLALHARRHVTQLSRQTAAPLVDWLI